jgi:hypothetical protein
VKKIIHETNENLKIAFSVAEKCGGYEGLFSFCIFHINVIVMK